MAEAAASATPAAENMPLLDPSDAIAAEDIPAAALAADSKTPAGVLLLQLVKQGALY